MANSGCLFGPFGGLFGGGKTATLPIPTPPIPPSVPALTIPYPEEPKDLSKTIANTDINAVLDAWETKYNVPPAYWDWWKTQIAITLGEASWSDDILVRFNIKSDTPAFTLLTTTARHLYCLAPWFNAGVIAHEQAHNSYAMLSQPEKDTFSAVYSQFKNTDPLIKLLYSVNPYGTVSDIEGHAELYRYLNDKMPEALKKFYPKLIEVSA